MEGHDNENTHGMSDCLPISGYFLKVTPRLKHSPGCQHKSWLLARDPYLGPRGMTHPQHTKEGRSQGCTSGVRRCAPVCGILLFSTCCAPETTQVCEEGNLPLARLRWTSKPGQPRALRCHPQGLSVHKDLLQHRGGAAAPAAWAHQGHAWTGS